MQTKALKHLRSLSPGFGQALWATMVAAHAPAVVAAWRTFITGGFALEHVGGCVGLSLTMLFFGLKLCRVRWLQLRAGRRAWVGWCLIVALIHVDCIRPGLDQSTKQQCVIVLATTALVAGLTRASKTLKAAPAHATTSRTCRPPITGSDNTIWLGVFRPHCWVLASRLIIPRPPPAWQLHIRGLW